MQYLRSYQYVFDSPNWFSNLLMGILCQIIPVIGPLTFMGYQYEVIEELHLSRGGRYPDFTFNRFTSYLTRGVWPFLVQLLGVVPFMFFVFLLIAIAFAGIALAGANTQNPGPIMAVFFVVLFALYMFGILALMFVLVPLRLWAGLAQDLKPGTMWRFMKEFFGLVFLDLLLCEVFGVLSGIVMGMVGVLMCFVGIYFTTTLVVYAQAHLVYQVYELYLERGGSEIKLRIEEGTRPT
jgi:hypothetical protein